MVSRDGDDTVSVLLERVQFGDSRAAEALMRRAEPVARSACRAEGKDLPTHLVDELVQEALLIVWTKRSGFDPGRGEFKSWVRGICRMYCRNQRRRKRDILTHDGVLEGASPERGALRLLREEERKRVVTAAIETLGGEDQDVLYHRYVHELSRSKIAEMLDLEVDEIRVRLQSASRRFRRALTRQLEALGHSFFDAISEVHDAP